MEFLGLGSSDKLGGIMKSSCRSLFVSLYSKPLITLSINLVGKSAFLNLFLSEYFTGKYLQCKSIIWPVWQNGRVFVYKLSDYGFEYHFSHIKYCV